MRSESHNSMAQRRKLKEMHVMVVDEFGLTGAVPFGPSRFREEIGRTCASPPSAPTE